MDGNLKRGPIMAVRPDPTSLYTIPAEISEDHGDEITVGFAAGNEKPVKIDPLKPSTSQDLKKFETGLKLGHKSAKMAS
jgi:hypothetical protein